MRIGENVFCIGYLIFAFSAGLYFCFKTAQTGDIYYRICAYMTLLLGSGDAFHLIPRIVFNFAGPARFGQQQKRRDFLIGFGNLISSLTMTIFYLFFYAGMSVKHSGFDEAVKLIDRFNVYLLLVALAMTRIVLCLLPQNRWFTRDIGIKWSVYRNIPFVIMGIITTVCLILWYSEWLMATLVVVSFICYMIVVLGAKKNPMLGMLMIPKTICYILMIILFSI